MKDATELSWFEWTRACANPNDAAALFICRLASGYKLLAWAIGSNRHNDPGVEITYYWQGLFNFSIMYINNYIGDHTNLHVTHAVLLSKNLPVKDFGVNRKELLVVLNGLGGQRLNQENISGSITESKPIINKATCSECNGTKVIDTGFYKRACMRCYEE